MQSGFLLYLLLFFFFTRTFSCQRLFVRDEQFHWSSIDPEKSLIQSRQLDAREFEINLASSTQMLHGSSALGYYFTTLYFGTPAQKQTLIVDTGSTITTIPCTECGSNCGNNHFNEFFNPKSSKTFEEIKCRERIGNYVCTDCNDHCSFSIGYSEGSSYVGKYKKDYVSFNESPNSKKQYSSNDHQSFRKLNFEQAREKLLLENDINLRPISDSTLSDTKQSSVLMPFGCTLKESNLFLTQEADGILGLGVNTNSAISPPNIIDSLHIQNSSISNAFSLCLGPEGGYFAVGGYNNTFHSSLHQINYVSYDGSFGQYRINWRNVKFQGKDLNISQGTLNAGKGAYIDSGTTLFYTSDLIAKTIKESLLMFCEESNENCGSTKRENMCWMYDKNKHQNIQDFFATFGNFTFGFGENEVYDYEWRPEDYLYYVPGEIEYYCFGLQAISGTRTILGGTFMKNHDILFDKHNKRIGFIRANCSAEYSFESYPKPRQQEPKNKFFIIIMLVMILTAITSIIFYLKKNKKWISEIQSQHLELPISPSRNRRDSSSSGSLESTDLRLLSDSSGDTSLQELEEQFSV